MKQKIAYIILIITSMTSCYTEETYDTSSRVPDTSIDIYIDLVDEDLMGFIESVGSSMTLTKDDYGGYAGLILYCYAKNRIRAFDRCCPIHYDGYEEYEDDDDIEQLDINGSYAMCPTDSIIFSFLETYPYSLSNEISTVFMREYNTSINDDVLHIYN